MNLKKIMVLLVVLVCSKLYADKFTYGEYVIVSNDSKAYVFGSYGTKYICQLEHGDTCQVEFMGNYDVRFKNEGNSFLAEEFNIGTGEVVHTEHRYFRQSKNVFFFPDGPLNYLRLIEVGETWTYHYICDSKNGTAIKMDYDSDEESFICESVILVKGITYNKIMIKAAGGLVTLINTKTGETLDIGGLE